MLSAFSNTFKIKELRQRILFTFGLLFICRLISIIPTPGIDATALRAFMDSMAQKAGGGMFGLYDLFSGGALRNGAVGFLGIMPYISASIIFQLMTAVIPALGRLAKEGDAGRAKLTQYQRYATVGLCLVQSFAMANALLHPERLGISGGAQFVSSAITPLGFIALTMITMTTGTLMLMWLGEQMTERGIGNGISMIITVNVVSRLPNAIYQFSNMVKTGQYNIFHIICFLAMMLIVVAAVVAMTQAIRKIPVQYAKRVVGNKQMGGGNTFMPLRVNYSGVMPIIFAQAILMLPNQALRFIPGDASKQFAAMFAYGTPVYMTFYGLMILFFSYFWVATQFNPVQIADDLKKHGGYVPGIRPGKPTADYLDTTMSRITLAGAVFLTVIATLPMILAKQFHVPFAIASFFGGTSLLIIVGVMLDTMRQVESHLLMRHYDGFLKKGKLRSRR